MHHINNNGWDELIFSNRNKLYGAYLLRKYYIARLLIATAAVLTVFAVFFTIPLLFPSNDDVDFNKRILISEYMLPPPENVVEPEKMVLPELKKIDKTDVFKPPVVVEAEIENTDAENNLSENAPEENNATAENGSEHGVLEGTGSDSDDALFIVVEELPMFPGGDRARSLFIQRNLKYPKLAQQHKIQGLVYVSFQVGKNGAISDVKVTQGLGVGCDEEAVRVVSMMPRWFPAKRRGTPVRTIVNMPIRFVLPVKSK